MEEEKDEKPSFKMSYFKAPSFDVDVMKASVMLEKKKEYATILAFDVKVTQEARELLDEQED
ncbi:hypothetical protein H5410_018471 [Solanum commersonii]|uniref:Uncharacterized protein n=1 Tax=Solanum commersonii TaxID=4109 RepID=A0A9J6A3H1_SOLCO|nr:hypothetical protein H5410_018471 [Solanum commersonii]